MSCRILLVDQHEITRIGLKALLVSLNSVKVCGEADNGIDAIRKAYNLRPNIIILDNFISRANGAIVTRRVLQDNPEQKILIFGVIESEETIRDLIRAGIHGFVSKSAPEIDLLCAIDALQHGRWYFSKALEKLTLDESLDPGVAVPQQHNYLSLREQEVLQLIAEGMLTKEVAKVLGISIKTTEAHRTNLRRKLGVHNLAQATLYAIAHHVLEMPIYESTVSREKYWNKQSVALPYQGVKELPVVPTNEGHSSPLRLTLSA